MVGCFPCGGSALTARSHLNQCYPASKLLVSAGPDYKPLHQDLSKLVYFAVNKPSQLAKIGEELETRVGKEARGSSGGYAKSRASLLISLSILRSLIIECKRDLGLFSRSALRIIVISLDVKVYQKGGPDLEVVARAASCFTAFATYTDGSPIGVDDSLTRDYITALTQFGRMAVQVDEGAEKPDTEKQIKARMVGLASLSGASASDALFLSTTHFKRQVEIILPALLANLFEAPLDDLRAETAKIDDSPSAFFSEFSGRRSMSARRSVSLRGKTGEKGSTAADVLSAALRALKALVVQCQSAQASIVVDAVVAYLDQRRWGDVERCCWLTEELAKFASLQTRFVVPTRLAEILGAIPDAAPTARQSTLLAMITSILNSSVSLVGLSVPDTLGHLLSLIVRRIRINERDSLLPPLVQCVASLGASIYYPDQINDIVEEISHRIAEVSTGDKNRPEILRVLIHCMTAVLKVVHTADDREAATSPVVSTSADKGKGPQLDTPLEAPQRQSTSRRSPIAPEVWQETLPLLCESSYAVRAVYARALLLFLQRELPRQTTPDASTTRFSNALHAAVYTLAMSACLGAVVRTDDSPDISSPGSPVRLTDELPKANGEKEKEGKGVSFNIVEPTPAGTPTTATPPTGQNTPPKKERRGSRRVSLPLNRLNSSSPTPLASFDAVATPLDFAYIVKILDNLHTVIPSVALMTGGPMLFALDAAAGTELVRRPGDGRSGAWVLERKRGVREAVGLVWRGVGRQWNVGTVEDLAERTLSALPEPNVIPTLYTPDESDILPPPDEPLSFTPNIIEGESSSTSQPLYDSEIIVSSLASSAGVQRATNGDAAAIVRRLGGRWSVETALKDSIETYSSAKTDQPSDTHFDIANALMTQSNASYRSFSRTSTIPTKSVDVSDLREALGQGQGRSRVGSRAASISSSVGTGPRSFVSTGSPGSRMIHSMNGRKEDVREVLKDIFREKKRGKAPSGGQGVPVGAAA